MKPMGKKAALRMLQGFWESSNQDPFEVDFYLGGLCGSQFGWPTQCLHSVDVRRLSIAEAEELGKRGSFYWYTPDYFTPEQLTWLLSGGTVKVTFGIFDVEVWEVEEVIEIIED